VNDGKVPQELGNVRLLVRVCSGGLTGRSIIVAYTQVIALRKKDATSGTSRPKTDTA
jgi:hypothetical protein